MTKSLSILPRPNKIVVTRCLFLRTTVRLDYHANLAWPERVVGNDGAFSLVLKIKLVFGRRYRAIRQRKSRRGLIHSGCGNIDFKLAVHERQWGRSRHSPNN